MGLAMEFKAFEFMGSMRHLARSSGRLVLAVLAIALLAACGGGGGGGGGSTPPAAPVISAFTAAKSPITLGAGTTLSATFAHGTGTVDQGVGSLQSGVPVAITPVVDTTYTLTVSGPGGTVAKAVTVTVVAAPSITGFTAGKSPITSGTATALTAVFADGTATVDQDLGAVASGVPIDTGNLSASTTYTLTVTNAAGDSRTAQATVDVVPAALITAFTATPALTPAGTSATLIASFENGVGTVDHGVGAIVSGNPGVRTGALAMTTTFTLTVTNPAGDAATATTPVTVPTFAPTGTMMTGTGYATATLLPSGKTLIGGGYIGYWPYDLAEIYDPSLGTFASTPGLMTTERWAHTATLLPEGKVLLASGYYNVDLVTAERFDPAAGTFTATTGNLATAREYAAAALLPNGKVLIAGGLLRVGSSSTVTILNSAELYDPSTGTFAATGPMSTARFAPTATLLPNGKVLVTGGWDYVSTCYASSELYDPATGTFAPSGTMGVARVGHTATLLPNGKVLVAAGISAPGGYLAGAELYDPSTGTFTASGTLATARFGHTATLLANGKVLLAGGANSAALASAELYDPATATFLAAGSMSAAREVFTETRLPNGKVLLAGGYIILDAQDSQLIASADLFDPGDPAPGFPCFSYCPSVYVFKAGVAGPVISPCQSGATAWSISPGLPAGLNLDPALGTITGTPSGAAPAQAYQVTAGNGTNASYAFLWLSVTP